jgi:hypothetical protein
MCVTAHNLETEHESCVMCDVPWYITFILFIYLSHVTELQRFVLFRGRVPQIVAEYSSVIGPCNSPAARIGRDLESRSVKVRTLFADIAVPELYTAADGGRLWTDVKHKACCPEVGYDSLNTNLAQYPPPPLFVMFPFGRGGGYEMSQNPQRIIILCAFSKHLTPLSSSRYIPSILLHTALAKELALRHEDVCRGGYADNTIPVRF